MIMRNLTAACALFVTAVLAGPATALAQPVVNAFGFTPAIIDTSAGPADVTVNFTLSGLSNPVYFEMSFADPSGAFVRRGIKSLTPPGTGPNSVVVSFPRFSGAGIWKVLAVFAADALGKTTFLDTTALALAGFPTNLTVTSAVDTTPPAIVSYSFTPTSIDTTSSAQIVTVTLTASDNLSIASLYAGFKDPAEQILRGTRVNSPADFASAPSVTKSFVINFPKGSPSGVWKVSFINAVDAAGNTFFLDTAAAAIAFPSAQTLTVTSLVDTTAPNLSAPLTIFTSEITTAGGPVNVGFSVTDDLSGANYFGISFQSPSGAQFASAASSFAATTSYNGSVIVNFPAGTEIGTWTAALVFLADAAGNTRTLNQAVSLVVSALGADTTPPVITPTFSPMPNGAGWNNSIPVTLTWSVTDPESGIASQSGCGPTTLSVPTTGAIFTCAATNSAPIPLSNSASVTVKIDTAPPITSNVKATPNPIALGTNLKITATVTDAGGSGVAAAEFKVDNGPFDDLAATDGSFGGSTEAVSVTFPGSHPLLTKQGLHTICVRGIDIAGNIGATACVTVAVHDENSINASGGTDSPAGADPLHPAASGPVTFSFNAKYGDEDSAPKGNLEFKYKEGDISFKDDFFDYLVVTESRAQIQGTGTLNGTTVCKFSIDAYDSSFGPSRVDAFGLRIFNCGGGTADRYNLPVTQLTKGKIQIRE